MWLPVLVNLGFAVFVSYYLLLRALPKITDDFRASLKEAQETHRADMAAARVLVKETVEKLAREIAGVKDALARLSVQERGHRP